VLWTLCCARIQNRTACGNRHGQRLRSIILSLNTGCQELVRNSLMQTLSHDFFKPSDLHYRSMQKLVDEMERNSSFPVRSVDLSEKVS
jgi:hypothetical protein